MKRLTVLIFMFCGLVGCEEAPNRSINGSPAVGADVTVLLRRDAMGVVRSPAVDPFSTASDGTKIVFQGKLISVDHEWVALDTQPGATGGAPLRVWVPREAVLAIAQDRPDAR